MISESKGGSEEDCPVCGLYLWGGDDCVCGWKESSP